MTKSNSFYVILLPLVMMCYNSRYIKLHNHIGENMTELQNATTAPAEEAQEPVQAQAPQEAQAVPTEVESVAVENQDSLNVEKEAEKSTEWYEDQLKQRNAESARRRDKEKELKAENERLASRLESMVGNAPTLEGSGNDYDVFEAEKRKHEAKLAYVELQKEDSDIQLEAAVDPVQETYKAQIDSANKQLNTSLQGYYEKGGTVNQDVFAQKGAIVDEAIINRPPNERAEIISELAKVDTANSLLNLADNAALRYAISNGSMFEALSAIHKSEVMQKTVSQAPAPVPEVEGSGGIPPQGDPAKMTPTQYKAWKASRK